MNKTFSKHFVLLTAAVCLFASGLTGCGGKDDAASTDTPATKSSSTGASGAPTQGAPQMATPTQATPTAVPGSK